LVFEVGQKGDTQKWYFVNQDIGPLCGDADGCTMKFFLQENSTDRVRTISEQIYIEQPGKSSNKSPGLHAPAAPSEPLLVAPGATGNHHSHVEAPGTG
jgi:hypothetical protein